MRTATTWTSKITLIVVVWMALLIMGIATPATAAASCNVESPTFTGSVETGPPNPISQGPFSLTFSTCTVTGEVSGVTIGAFKGIFTGPVSGPVSGTWSIDHTGTTKVMASGSDFSVSISINPALPSPGLTFQGTLTIVGAGAPFLLVHVNEVVPIL